MGLVVDGYDTYIKGLIDVTGKKNELFLRYVYRESLRREGLPFNLMVDLDDISAYLARSFTPTYSQYSSEQKSKLIADFFYQHEEGYNSFSISSSDDLLWLEGKNKDRERLIVWFYCRAFRRGIIYERLDLPQNPVGENEIYVISKEFVAFAFNNSRRRNEFLSNLRGVCSESVAFKKPFSWIKPDDDDGVSWLWDYLMKKDIFSRWISPSIYSDRLKLLTAAFLVWGGHPDSKKLLLKEIKAAWYQKSFRDKNKDNGRINTYVGKEARSALDEMLEGDDVDLNVFLKGLIMSEYKKRSGILM